MPRRHAFHLSLTVLLHCRSPGNILPCGKVPADSRGLSRIPRYSGYDVQAGQALASRGLSPRLAPRSRGLGLQARSKLLALWRPQEKRLPSTPEPQRRQACARFRFRPLSVSLAATKEIAVAYSSSGYLDGSVPRVPSHAFYIFKRVFRRLTPEGSPIRTSADLRLLAAPRGFSQPAASFFGSRRPGIRPAPLITYS